MIREMIREMNWMEDARRSKESDLGNAVVSWTGGKDGCYSCFKAMREGWRVTYLLSFRNISKIGSHDINPDLIRAQSDAIGIPLIQKDFISYEQEFKRAILELRARGKKSMAQSSGTSRPIRSWWTGSAWI